MSQYSLVTSASPADHHGVHALVAHLAYDQPGFGVIAADVQNVDLSLLELGNKRGEVLLACCIGLVHLLLHAALVGDCLVHLVGEAFAVGGLVVKDGDFAREVGVGEEVAGHQALLVVAPAGAEHVPDPAIGEFRIGRGRRDLQDALVGIALGRRDRGTRAEMPGHNRRRPAGQLVGPTATACFGSHASSPTSRTEFFAENAACGVDVLDRLFGTGLHLGAERRVLPSHRPGDGDCDVGLRTCCVGKAAGSGR